MGDDQVQRDADAIYEAAYELHGTIMVSDLRERFRDWSPLSRLPLAMARLVDQGLVSLEEFRGQKVIRLANPFSPDASERPPA